MSQQKPDDAIEVEIELDELDLTSAESKATYAEIKDYVLKTHGLKVSSLYISQVKRKCGIEVAYTSRQIAVNGYQIQRIRNQIWKGFVG